MILERWVDRLAMRTTPLFICQSGDEFMQIDDEDTMCMQMERYVKYEDARLLAIEASKSVFVLHDWFFTWSGAIDHIKKNTPTDPDTSTCLHSSIIKLPFFGYIVLRTIL